MPISPVVDISESRPEEQKMVLLMPVEKVLHCKLSGPGDAFSSASLQAEVSLLEVKVSASVAFRITGTQKLSRIIKRRPQGSHREVFQYLSHHLQHPSSLWLVAEELGINRCLQPGCWLECKCLNFGEVTSVKWFNAVCCQELMNSVLQQVVP
ncbi:hypothetical protein llap_10791 [Limosa lapponica baueri]|uniref:Uncharacterized protein n=1 Tax=Limosa lapponica baueri TaxID=1758121 RepID=A0A2I0TYL7_LIMLA|nr:hypothetical protein llap_10791 [Limosa lapponica baueri]